MQSGEKKTQNLCQNFPNANLLGKLCVSWHVILESLAILEPKPHPTLTPPAIYKHGLGDLGDHGFPWSTLSTAWLDGNYVATPLMVPADPTHIVSVEDEARIPLDYRPSCRWAKVEENKYAYYLNDKRKGVSLFFLEEEDFARVFWFINKKQLDLLKIPTKNKTYPPEWFTMVKYVKHNHLKPNPSKHGRFQYVDRSQWLGFRVGKMRRLMFCLKFSEGCCFGVFLGWPIPQQWNMEDSHMVWIEVLRRFFWGVMTYELVVTGTCSVQTFLKDFTLGEHALRKSSSLYRVWLVWFQDRSWWRQELQFLRQQNVVFHPPKATKSLFQSLQTGWPYRRCLVGGFNPSEKC